jgi:hypothetical protein
VRNLALAATVILSGCATMPPAPKIVTQTVKVPTPVACVDRGSVPVKPEPVTLPSDARQAAAMATAQALAYEGWGDELMALIGPCTRD